MGEQGVSPLTEKTIVVTRAESQCGKLREELEARGAKVKLLPLIAFGPPDDFNPLDTALRQLVAFDWILFTSANAVQQAARRQQELGSPAESSKGKPRVAAVGPATAEAAAEVGFVVDYVATHHSGAGLAEELRDEVRGRKIFLPRSDRANPDLPAALKRHGAQVTEVVAYKTVTPGKADRERVNNCCKEEVDGILFFSPSAVQGFLELVDRKVLEKLQGRAVMVAVGPTTAGALSAAGIQRIAWAADTTNAAVVQALEGHLARTRKRTTAGAK